MDMGTDVVSVNQRKANANYKRSYFWFLGSAEEHEWQDLLWRGKKGGGPAPAALLVGVVIGVLSSRVTWLSREQELDICRRPSNPGLRLVRLPSPFYLEGGRACGQEKRRRRSNQNLGAVRLSCHSPCLSVGRCTTPSKGIKNLPRSPAGPCKGPWIRKSWYWDCLKSYSVCLAIPSLPCRLSVSVDLAPEGQFNPRSRKKRKIALKQEIGVTPGQKSKEETAWTCAGVCGGASVPGTSAGAGEVCRSVWLHAKAQKGGD
ncbi:armadillo repeat-containing X-linked protein 1 isoform X2 [Bos taurus]|uniref:armadillo repeat-containing X-linked protein 1 isoform X2 n=1 Tax=Bos taurus TaxID=9913 RepID=UPI000D5315A9|nr:armadillo repeat-containing X-linked protein 1 isoform X2 [Bos taurus]